jgi:hypothetical protein
MRPNNERSKAAVIIIAIVICTDILILFSNFLQLNLLSSVLAGRYIANSEFVQNDLRQLIITIVHLIAYIISGILFIMWFRRAYFNLHTKLKYLNFSEGWAAGAWFVPFVNLGRPYRIMKELYTETKTLIQDENPLVAQDLKHSYVVVWWTLWLVSSVANQILFRLPTNTIEEFMFVTLLNMFHCLLVIVLGLITIKMIKTYSNAENVLYEMHIKEQQ